MNDFAIKILVEKKFELIRVGLIITDDMARQELAEQIGALEIAIRILNGI